MSEKKSFLERVYFRKLKEEVNKSGFYGISMSEMVKIEVIDWGTNRDGSSFKGNEFDRLYKPGDIAYIKKDSMGIDVGDGTWLIDRGHILLID